MADAVSLPAVPGTEVRVKTGGKIRDYVSFVMHRLEPDTASTSHRGNVVTLTALGRAVPKAVAVAEIVKRTIGGLHQNTTIDSMTTTKENETPDAMQEATPDTEEETKTQPRRITVISISLSKELGSMNARDAGYQPPDANGIENENAIETEKSRDDAVTRPPPSAHAQRKQTRKEEVKSVGLLTKEESTEVPKARRKTRRGKGGKGKGDAMDIAE